MQGLGLVRISKLQNLVEILYEKISVRKKMGLGRNIYQLISLDMITQRASMSCYVFLYIICPRMSRPVHLRRRLGHLRVRQVLGQRECPARPSYRGRGSQLSREDVCQDTGIAYRWDTGKIQTLL